MSRSRSFAASATFGAALGAIAFGAGAGTDLSRNALVEVAILLAAGAVLAVGVLRGRRGPVHGGTALFCFAVLTAVTALSMSWSIAPDASLEEAGRTFAYLGIFASGLMVARIAPGATPAVLGGVLLAAVAVSGWALLTRVFPSDLGAIVLAARLSEPFGYWNALGSMAVVGVPAAVWLGTRRASGAATSALAYPALGILLLTTLLTQSRGAVAAAAIATLVWLAVVPLRLRTVAVVAIPALAVAPIAAWALSKDAFTEAFQPDSAREAVAGEFGLMLLALIVGLFAAGLAVQTASLRRAPSLPVRRRTGIALAVVACAVPLLGLTSVAMSDRGLGGTISDRVDEITDDQTGPPRGAARLGSVSSSRGGYWRQARDVFDERRSVGRGAGSFGLASLKHRKSPGGSVHAHGFFAQTAADLGLVGLAASLALLAAWLAAVARATGTLPRRRPRPEWDGQRTAVTALALCTVVFGLHSLVDWTWFVPGPSAAALLAAGFVAGRGPLGRGGLGRMPESQASGRPGAGRVLAAAAVIVTAALCAWAVWQPERAARSTDRATSLQLEGKNEAALREADSAREIFPYSADPLYVRAEVFDAMGHRAQAYRALEQAVIEHPRDPETWLRLGRYELETLDLPDRAVESAIGAFGVEPNSGKANRLKQAAIAAGGVEPPPRP